LKNQVGKIKFIFAGYTGSKDQVQNRLKIQFVKLDFSKLIFQKSSTDQQGVSLVDACLLSWFSLKEIVGNMNASVSKEYLT
jgi:hypothetical protein